MTALDDAALDALEEAAKGATPGPWTPDGPEGNVWAPGNRARVAQTYGYAYQRDATHIATADPPTVLALVAEVRRLREAVERVEDFASDLEAHGEGASIYETCREMGQLLRENLRGDLTASQDAGGPEGHDDADNDRKGRSRAREGKR